MDIIKNNFIIVTGGPGGGKSTLLKALHGKGFNYVDESARCIIKERLAKGLALRPAPEEFARQIFDMDVEQYHKNTGNTGLLFFDRSFLDSAAMLHEAGGAHFDEIKEFVRAHRFFSKVYFTPPWQQIYTNDSERDQTFDDAVNVYKRLYNWYMLNGYTPVILPKISVERRVEFMLHEIITQRY